LPTFPLSRIKAAVDHPCAANNGVRKKVASTALRDFFVASAQRERAMATSSKFNKLTSADISNAKPVRKGVRLISRQELVDIVGVSFPSIWQWVREGKFPAPRKLGKGGRTAWLESEIEAWAANLPVRRYKDDAA
jgi:prophage regulatory protein